ncbi:MAG: glycosyltransferase [Proteobacteria bacterium]|nr:glycosyltransferase [Pseudomonadota bacterium]
MRKKIQQMALSADKGWGQAYPIFSRIVNKYRLKCGIEIGVAFGGHSEAILHRTQTEKLYGVDPYRHFDNYDDPMNLLQSEFDTLYEFTLDRLAKFGTRFQLIREFSEQAAMIIDENIDFVYIDALHTYEGVHNDLAVWFQKVRDGGIIGGHDYGHPNFPGVKVAVDEFFVRFGWKVNDEGEGVWWVKKKQLQTTFIIPAFNSEKTIKHTLDSIFDGNFKEGDEIVVTNDCSNDSTKEILEHYSAKCHPLNIINHLENKGGAAARNSAIENAKNDLIFCIDSDNILESNSVSKLKNLLLSTGAHAAAFQELWYFRNSPDFITHKWVFPAGMITFEDCMASGVVPISSGNYLYTKESWRTAGGYPEFAHALDAWGFGLRQLAQGQKMVVLENSGYFHRHGHESYWVRENRTGVTSLLALQILLPFLGLLKTESVRYVTGAQGRRTWFENLDLLPLAAKSGRKGRGGAVVRR